MKVVTDMRTLSECNFKSGERLQYRIHYGIITGGQAVISTGKTTVNNESVMHAKVDGRTSGLIDKIYRVADVYESFFRDSDNLPVKAIRNISEGKYRYYDEVSYGYDSAIDSCYIVSQRKGKHIVPKRTLDMVSVFFFLRRINMNTLRMNEVVTFNTWFGDELFPFYVVYKGRETVSIKSGEYRCHKFVPVVEPGRVFKDEDDMTVWFSADRNKIPVSIKFDIWVGSFRCDLEEFSNLKYPLDSKIE
jgi:hypothetical protein